MVLITGNTANNNYSRALHQGVQKSNLGDERISFGSLNEVDKDMMVDDDDDDFGDQKSGCGESVG